GEDRDVHIRRNAAGHRGQDADREAALDSLGAAIRGGHYSAVAPSREQYPSLSSDLFAETLRQGALARRGGVARAHDTDDSTTHARLPPYLRSKSPRPGMA